MSVDKVDLSRRVLLRKTLSWSSGRPRPRSRACPLTAGCGRYHERACGANKSTEDAMRTRRVLGAHFGRVGASFGPARGRHDDGSAEACRSGSAGVSAASDLVAAHGSLCAPEAYPMLTAGSARDGAGDNVTPREDYRTAVPFDSPDAGCSLSSRGVEGSEPIRLSRDRGTPSARDRTSGSPFRITTTVRTGPVQRTRTRALRPLGR